MMKNILLGALVVGTFSQSGAAPSARLTYLGTSGWFIETTEGSVVIDYVGQDSAGLNLGPSLSVLRPHDAVRKPAIVIVTHQHEDHYAAALRHWADSLGQVVFAAGDAVPLRAGDVRLDPRATVRLGPAQVWTIRSTDEGVGVLVRIGGITIFHAGDHARWNAATDSAYRAEIDSLAGLGVPIDIALLPIATGMRCEATSSIQEGALYAITKLRPHVTLPMHVRCVDRMASLYGEFAQSAGRSGATVLPPRRIGEAFSYERPRLVRVQR